MTAVLVLGGGAVGTNAALILDRLGFEVTLLESEPDVLLGAPQLTFITHGDGFEYYKPAHLRTGQYCVDGAITKALLYPLSKISAHVSTSENPVRFFVASATLTSGAISLQEFFRNAEDLKRHFTEKYRAISAVRGWTDDQASKVFLRTPDTFWSKLSISESEDLDGISAGCCGSSFGVNMPVYYALVRSALRRSHIDQHFGVTIERIERAGKRYEVYTDVGRFRTDQILLCASHQTPALISLIVGTELRYPISGTYYLNSMTFVTLPATRNAKVLSAVRRINFTLQGTHGAMFACVLPPNERREGLAAIYYPSRSGSQRKQHFCRPGTFSPVPEEWSELIRQGLSNDDTGVVRTFEQACLLYPLLRDYARVQRTICRTVFNVTVPDSNGGLDRRVREISPVNGAITSDGRVSAWAAPKWTNAELVALQAADYVCSQTETGPLPKGTHKGCGPTDLDVAKISESINFRNIEFLLEDARRYTQCTGLPEDMIAYE